MQVFIKCVNNINNPVLFVGEWYRIKFRDEMYLKVEVISTDDHFTIADYGNFGLVVLPMVNCIKQDILCELVVGNKYELQYIDYDMEVVGVKTYGIAEMRYMLDRFDILSVEREMKLDKLLK
jgi:hypothetical protein